MSSAQLVVLAVAAGLVGLAIGSFTCVIIDRLPVELDEPNSYGETWDTRPWREVFGGTSRCSSCGEPVRRSDNIPVVSWLLLRGKCRACGDRIPAFHPLVELAVPLVGAAIVVANVSYDGWTWALMPYLFVVPVGVAVSVIDWRVFIVPTRIVWPSFFGLVALSAIAALLEGEPSWLLGGLVGIGVLAGPLFVMWWFLAAKMGFGDVRLCVVLGWVVGFAAMAAGGGPMTSVMLALVVMVVASALGILHGVAYGIAHGMVKWDRKRKVPFGPSVVTATFLALVFVEPFVEPFL